MKTSRIHVGLLLFALLLAFPARAEERHLYLVPNPVESEIRVGPVSRTLNYLSHIVSLGLRVGAVWKAGSPALAVAWGVYDVLHFPALVAGTNIFDLSIRQQIHDTRLFNRLSAVPDLQRAHLLTGSSLELKGIVPNARQMRNLILLETNEPLPEAILRGEKHPGWSADWATPIEIKEPEDAFVTFQLKTGQTPHDSTFRISVADLIAGKDIPADIRAAWRSEVVAADQSTPPFWKTALMLAHPASPTRNQIEATLEAPGIGKIELGTVASAGDINKLLKIGLWGKFLAKMPWRKHDRIAVKSKNIAAGGCLARLGRLLHGAKIGSVTSPIRPRS